MSAYTDQTPVGAALAEAKGLLAVTHGEGAATLFAAPDAQATIYKVVGSAVPFHSLGVGLHAPIKPKSGYGYWIVKNISVYSHSILSYDYRF